MRRAKVIALGLGLVFILPGVVAAAAKSQPPAKLPLAYTKADQPVWVRRVLKRLETKKRWRVQQYRLFRSGGTPSFLALIWTGINGGTDYLELYRVNVITHGNVRLSYVRGYSDAHLSISKFSGRNIIGDGVAHLILEYGSGGSWYRGYGVRIYRLVRNSVDVTPDWAGRADKFISLGPGDRPNLIVSDDRWGGFFLGCGDCGPRFHIVMTWTNKGYTPACRNYPGHYEKIVEEYEKWRNSGKLPWPTAILKHLWSGVGLAFNQLQGGHFEQAIETYKESLAEAKKRGARGWDTPEKNFRFWVNAVETKFGPALIAATSAGREFACPLMAHRGRGGHIGEVIRIDHFRFRKTP